MSNQEKVLKVITPFMRYSKKYETSKPKLSYYLSVYVAKELNKHYLKLKGAG